MQYFLYFYALLYLPFFRFLQNRQFHFADFLQNRYFYIHSMFSPLPALFLHSIHIEQCYYAFSLT